jgi:hypothetical protein
MWPELRMGVEGLLCQDNLSDMQQLQEPITVQAFIHIYVLKYVFSLTKNFIYFMLSNCMRYEQFD